MTLGVMQFALFVQVAVHLLSLEWKLIRKHKVEALATLAARSCTFHISNSMIATLIQKLDTIFFSLCGVICHNQRQKVELPAAASPASSFKLSLYESHIPLKAKL